MNACDWSVPAALHGARLVPRQQPGSRVPMRVTPGAFKAAGLPVPEDRRQWNSYQLSRRCGFPWTPAIDAHVGRRGGELLGVSGFVCVDCDTSLAIDGSVWLDGFRRLADLAAESGNVLDFAGCIAVRTPGNGTHGQGWHLWFGAPDRPVRLGPLARCPLIEIKNRATAPGSPGYEVRSVPDASLARLPAWLAELAGAPHPVVAAERRKGSGAPAWRRLEGIFDFLRELRDGDQRNRWIHWGACRCAEMIAAGELDAVAAERVLLAAAKDNGYVADHGAAAALATIRSGFRTAVAA